MSEQGLKFGKPLVKPEPTPAGSAASADPKLDSASEMPPADQTDSVGQSASEPVGDSSIEKTDVVAERAAEDDGSVTYSSHPMHNFNLGPYEFQKAILTLPRDKVEEFEKLWKSQPPLIQNMIRKIDVAAAHNLVAARIGSNMSAGIDTTSNTYGNKG